MPSFTLEAAAQTASLRGACDTAGDLAELAVAFTPLVQLEGQRRRTVMAAQERFEASDPARACQLLDRLIEVMPAGPARAEILRRAARYRMFCGTPLADWAAALTEAGDDTVLRAVIMLDQTVATSQAGEEIGTARPIVELAARRFRGNALCRFSQAVSAKTAYAIEAVAQQSSNQRHPTRPAAPAVPSAHAIEPGRPFIQPAQRTVDPVRTRSGPARWTVEPVGSSRQRPTVSRRQREIPAEAVLGLYQAAAGGPSALRANPCHAARVTCGGYLAWRGSQLASKMHN